jgi:site-specific recombinase XerD
VGIRPEHEEIDVDNPFSFDPAAWQRLHSGPLGPYIDPFAQHLAQQGYARASIYDKLRMVAKLSRWMACLSLDLAALDEQQVAAFLQDLHQRQRRARRGDISTLRTLLEQLRNLGVIPMPLTASDPNTLQRLKDDFTCYLREERGLASTTVDNYLPFVDAFLTARFGGGPLELEHLGIQDVIRFVLSHLRRFSPKRAQLGLSALRGFFRFLNQRGVLLTDLASAVPAVANWRLSEIPKFIAPQEVEQLLLSCDQDRVAGQRDYTVLLLLARLGLRAGEVVHLQLDDIDWRAGRLHIRGKGGRSDALPLPADVGEALAAYLRHGRPRCSTRRVFVRARAPHTGFASSVAVDSIVRRALQRARLNPPRKGAHLLRHSLATRMLRDGASLAEIGQLLRHRLPQTTEIYAKVDPVALGALVQPWPGEQP